MNWEKYSEKILLLVAIIVLGGMAILNSRGNDFQIQELADLPEEDKVSTEVQEDIGVHIIGEVHSPGVYYCKPGERLSDLVERAGNLTASADVSRINLAMRLEDEMKIVIPTIGQEISEEIQIQSAGKNDGKVELNSASKLELMTLPGVGEKTADKIIDYRESSPFTVPEDIKNVPGIGDKTFQSMEELIYVK